MDTLQGGRDEMRGLGARFVSPLLRGFSPALGLCLLGWCLCVLWLCLFCVLLSLPVERLLQVIPVSLFFAFAFLGS